MKTPRVLFIDDEVTLIQNLAETLMLMGYETSVAANGEQGLKALRSDSFDIVVLDLRMPGLSGMDVLKEINPILRTSPEVIILTGYASVDTGIEGLRKGAFDYLSKPIKIRDLVERIGEAWERKKMKSDN